MEINMIDKAKNEFKLLNEKLELSLREKIIREALQWVGTTEQENNDNPFGHYYNFNNVAWCGLFCSYVYWMNGIVLPNTNKGRKGMAYVPAALTFFVKNNCLTNEPKEGDLIIFEFTGDKLPDHVGIFHKEINTGVYYCIEGNTSFDEIGSQSNGGAVAYKKRYKRNVVAFIDMEKIKKLKLEP